MADGPRQRPLTSASSMIPVESPVRLGVGLFIASNGVSFLPSFLPIHKRCAVLRSSAHLPGAEGCSIFRDDHRLKAISLNFGLNFGMQSKLKGSLRRMYINKGAEGCSIFRGDSVQGQGEMLLGTQTKLSSWRRIVLYSALSPWWGQSRCMATPNKSRMNLRSFGHRRFCGVPVRLVVWLLEAQDGIFLPSPPEALDAFKMVHQRGVAEGCRDSAVVPCSRLFASPIIGADGTVHYTTSTTREPGKPAVYREGTSGDTKFRECLGHTTLPIAPLPQGRTRPHLLPTSDARRGADVPAHIYSAD
ncbi:hypothetical protein B0H17DRAFT_1139084 [Mycena rosella]|uniref:Uncharacterized protein n=1 Tax=Mycena rosella TaxID=1033263 RepID=A0AAD7D4Z4_MYCRO|nr:hypothetical protein B0H17DRAFT_1139084 [Mycena rosella]